ncbi:MAG: hypothetical protein ABIF12_00525 [bacterium]
MNKRGSAFLIVIFVSGLLSLITFSMWFKSSLFLGLVVERERFYKNFYLTESIMNFCLDFVKNQYDDILQQESWPIKYNLNFLLEAIVKSLNSKDLFAHEFCAEMIVNKQKLDADQVQIFVNLNRKEPYKTLCSLACNLKKKEVKEGDFNNENSKQNKYKTIFIVKNYSISPIV